MTTADMLSWLRALRLPQICPHHNRPLSTCRAFWHFGLVGYDYERERSIVEGAR